MALVRVQTEDFDIGAAFAALTAGRHDIGGIGCFVGTVRADSAVVALTLEHYPAMTQRALERIAAEAERRWSLLRRVRTSCWCWPPPRIGSRRWMPPAS
jgi:molybdopterin synthase catalytic subunit